MEDSILTSTKNVLGLDGSYEAFDQEILTFINTAFSTLQQLGVGPTVGFSITNKETKWNAYLTDQNLLGLVKTYVYLVVRLMFDPPTTSYLIEATDNQKKEYEWRINVYIEGDHE